MEFGQQLGQFHQPTSLAIRCDLLHRSCRASTPKHGGSFLIELGRYNEAFPGDFVVERSRKFTPSKSEAARGCYCLISCTIVLGRTFRNEFFFERAQHRIMDKGKYIGFPENRKMYENVSSRLKLSEANFFHRKKIRTGRYYGDSFS